MVGCVYPNQIGELDTTFSRKADISKRHGDASTDWTPSTHVLSPLAGRCAWSLT
ncbi:hypothetical protein D3C86_2197330 [compost metagenome]